MSEKGGGNGVRISTGQIYALLQEVRDLARDTNNKQKEHSEWIREHAKRHEEKGGYDERLIATEGETEGTKTHVKALWTTLSAIVLYIVGAFIAK